MSTYAIASAIEQLAENFKKVMDDKNKIEREKLEFEKEKFKQLTNTECDHEWEAYSKDNSLYACKKCGIIQYQECEHDWIFDRSITNSIGTYIYYKCRKCSTEKYERQ